MLLPYLCTLALTMSLELIVAILLIWWVPALRKQPVCEACICINLVTHPLATIALFDLAVPVIQLELLVFCIESLAYRFIAGIPWLWSISLSVIANALTMGLGYVLS